MKSRHAGRPGYRWREALLGGLAGLGVPALLRGRAQGRKGSSPAAVGVVAGLLGALVGGRLARRAQGEPKQAQLQDIPQEQERSAEPAPHRKEAPEPRRGPSGRERLWLLPGFLSPTS